jgi:hypothetical protein
MSDVLRNAVNTFYISSVAERVTTVSMWDSTIPGWTRRKELARAKQEAKRLAQNYINKLDDIDWWQFEFTLGVGWKKALPSLWEKLLLKEACGILCPKRAGAPKEKSSEYFERMLARARDTD